MSDPTKAGEVGQAAPGAAAPIPGPPQHPSLPIGQRATPQPDAGEPADVHDIEIELGADHDAGAVVIGFGVTVRTLRLPAEHADLFGRLMLHKAREIIVGQAGTRPELPDGPKAKGPPARPTPGVRLHKLKLRPGWATLRVTIPPVFTGLRAWLAIRALRFASWLLRMNCEIVRR